MKKKSKKLLSDTLLFFIGSIGSKFIQFFLVPLYTYTLSTIEYGTSDLLLTTVNFLMPIFSLQVSDALLRFGLDKKISQIDTITTCIRILMYGTIFTIVFSPFLLLYKPLSNYIFYFVIILNLKIYRDIFSIILKIEDKNKAFAIDSIIYTFVLCISSFVFLVLLKAGIVGYFLSYIIATIFSIIYIIININYKLNNIKNKIKKDLLKKIVLYSLPMIVNSISYWITMASDRYMIGFFMNISMVGIYAVATKIPTIVTTFTGIFNQAWMISSINEYENDRDSKFYSATFNYYTGISLITCALLIAIIKPFMHFYVSSNYYIAWKYTILLIIAAAFSGICAFINGIFYAYKKNISATITTLIGAIFNILLNLLLIPNFGIMGASIATLMSWMIIAISRLISVNKILTIEIKYLKIFSASLLLVLENIVLLFCNNIIYSIIFITLILFIIMYVYSDVIISIVIIIFNFIKKKDLKKKIRKYFRFIHDRNNIKKLKNRDFSLICSNCTGGIIYHNLHLKFTSPTINLYFEASDFVKFCNNLDYYLNIIPKQIESNESYPVVVIDDIKMYGVHYKNAEEFINKWEERKKRINKNNIFIIMTERDGCKYEDLVSFDKLPYDNKIVFTHKKYEKIKSSYCVKNTEIKNDKIHKTKSLTDYKGNITPYRYIDDFDYVSWINGKD